MKTTKNTPASVKATAAAVNTPALTETKLVFFQWGKRDGETCVTFQWEFEATFEGAPDMQRLALFIGRKLQELALIYERQREIGAPFGGFSASKPLEFKVVGTGIASFGSMRNTFAAYLKGKKGGNVMSREQLAASVLSLLELVSVVRDEAAI
jgi:hypothetical protein